MENWINISYKKRLLQNQIVLKRWQANFNLQFVHAAFKYASQLGFMIGETANVIKITNNPRHTARNVT